FWLMGDLSRARMHGALLTLFVSLILIFMLWRKSTQLDAFLMGEENASGLGVSVPKLRRQFIWLTSFLVGLSVASSGMIGFLGLIVPHFSRKLVGSLHFNMIPFCIIWGAVALVLADLMARVLLRPYELPVGVITAFVGAPLFIWMILSDGRSRN
ncbi:MAG: iron ABC transporter permease, partial [Bdellovibrio sp.]|nr:iron ABC transporter permease [Bdellovibrio sp.]